MHALSHGDGLLTEGIHHIHPVALIAGSFRPVTLQAKPSPTAGDCNVGYYSKWQRDSKHICSTLAASVASLFLLYLVVNAAECPLMIAAVGQIARRSLLATGTLQYVCRCGYVRPLFDHWLCQTLRCWHPLRTCSPHRAQMMSHMSVMWVIIFLRTTPVWLTTSPDKVSSVLHHR